MKLALDVMGSDNAPAVEVAGAVAAARAYGHEILLVGRRADLERELANHDTTGLKLEIVEANTVVDMHEQDPARAVRQKQDSSLVKAFALVQNGTAQACVSAGNTGAFMAAALFELKRLPNVDRPAIAIVIRQDADIVTAGDHDPPLGIERQAVNVIGELAVGELRDLKAGRQAQAKCPRGSGE